MNHRPDRPALRQPSTWPWLAAAVLAAALGGVPGAARASGDPCQGVAHCRHLGPFTATAVRVNVTRLDKVTAYQTVRTTVRLTNVGRAPLVLGFRYKSSAVTDDQGHAYRWSNKAEGIGVVGGGRADTQFRLAPGQSRDATFEGVLQYSLRRQVAGNVFSHDITLVQLEPLGGSQVREARDHVVSFSGLTANTGYGAGAAAGLPRLPATSLPAPTAPISPDVAMQPGAGPAAAPSAGGCDGAGGCQQAGPLLARVVRVNVTRAGNVTAYQTVRTTLRFTNRGREPLILGYRHGSSVVSDETGQAYRWSSKAHGIGVVSAHAADPQFRLAPGESREAAFESTLQYNVRHSRPGSVFTHDLTIAQLAIVGPSQVRTLHEYALSFANLRAGAAAGALPGVAGAGTADAPDAVQAVNQVVDLLKGLKR